MTRATATAHEAAPATSAEDAVLVMPAAAAGAEPAAERRAEKGADAEVVRRHARGARGRRARAPTPLPSLPPPDF